MKKEKKRSKKLARRQEQGNARSEDLVSPKKVSKKKGAGETGTIEREEIRHSEDLAKHQHRCWESFFRCQPNPMIRSELLAAIMAGVVLEVGRVPTVALLDVVLLATAAREECNAEIVDDYDTLLQRARDEWNKPGWTTRVFDSIHASKANWILRGQMPFVCFEDLYIPRMVAWYLRQTMPEIFEALERVRKK